MFHHLTSPLLLDFVGLFQIQGTDSLSRAFRGYADWCDSLSQATMHFFLRATLLLLVPIGLCSVSFLRMNCRSIAGQWAFFLLGLFLASELPIHLIEFPTPLRAWFLAFASLGILTLPCVLAFLLTRSRPWRQGVCVGIWALLVFAYMVNYTHN